jgi:CheY-like chemotaxis protein
VPVILVSDAAAASQDVLVETLRRLFPRARVLAVRGDLDPEVVGRERADLVLASLAAAEHLCRAGAPSGVSVVALTHEMSPDTLLRAEAQGMAGALRAPVGAEQLAMALRPMLDPARQ